MGDVSLFAPAPPPAGFDVAKAKLALANIPDDPPATAKTQPSESKDINPQARRRLDEAKRLFTEQRYTETIIELEKALPYDANNAEAHRYIALACLLLGNEARARASAERALAIQPNDLASQYVMGRYAEKSSKSEDALRYYRLALKCEQTDTDKNYRILTQYYLGGLLNDAGYYAAAVEQLEAFEAGVAALGDRVVDNPELATIARVHRGAAAVRVAQAHELLKQYSAAAEALNRAADRSPKDLDLRTKYIRMLVLARQVNKAVDEATRLLGDSQGKPEAVELLLAVHRFSGHPERGVVAIKQVLAQQPNNIELSLLYADALNAAGRSAEALQSLNELLAAHPDAAAARWKLIAIYRGQNNWQAWLDALAGQLSGESTEDPRVGQELEKIPLASARKIVDQPGRAGIVRPTTAEARGSFAATQPSDTLLSAHDYLLGRLCIRLEKPDQARQLFEQTVKRSPRFLPVIVAIANLYEQQCRWDDVIKVIADAGRSHEEPVHALERLLGQAYEGLDDLEQAIAHYEKAIEISRGDIHTMMLLGELYDRVNQASKAQQVYIMVLSIDSNYMRAREAKIHSALSLLAQGGGAQGAADLRNKALAELTEMQRIAPQDPATIRSAALIKFLSPDTDQDRAKGREPYLATLAKLIEANPNDMLSREDRVKVLFEFREYDTARTELGEMLARDPHHADAHELLASVFKKLLAYDEAEAQYKRMLALYPNREAWLQQYLELRLIVQDFDEAIALCERLLSLKGVKSVPERKLVYRRKLIDCYCIAKRFDEARKLAEGWLATSQSEAALSESHSVTDDRFRNAYRTFLLIIDEAAKDHQKYIDDCRAWFKLEPKNVELRGLLINGLARAGQTEEAMALALQWLAETPEDSSIFDRLFLVFVEAHQLDPAIELARNQLASADRPELRQQRYETLYKTYLAAKRFDSAIRVFKEYLDFLRKLKNDSYANVIESTYLPSILMSAGRIDEAVGLMNRSLRETPPEDRDRRADLLRSLSAPYMRQGQHGLAEQRLREAYELDPTDVGINNDLGYTLAEAGKQLDQAKKMTRLAVGENPREGPYLDSYAWVLYKSGEFKESRTWLSRATTAERGEDVVIFDHLGDALWRLGDKNAAIKNWKHALEVQEEKSGEWNNATEVDVLDRLKSKITAVTAGKPPPVAATAAETKPAP